MLQCICSVVDHSWRQCVVRTKKWRSAPCGLDVTISASCDWSVENFLTSLESQESYLTLRNVTLQITRDFFRQHSTFARLYNAAASRFYPHWKGRDLVSILVGNLVLVGCKSLCPFFLFFGTIYLDWNQFRSHAWKMEWCLILSWVGDISEEDLVARWWQYPIGVIEVVCSIRT